LVVGAVAAVEVGGAVAPFDALLEQLTSGRVKRRSPAATA
jgi:hypothetical protein